MAQDSIRIEAKITPEAFREFSYFDTLGRQKRYKGPLLFFLIMGGAGCICLTQVGRRENALLLGCVMMGVGASLPAVYLLTFFLNVRSNAKLLARKGVPADYTMILSPAGITIPVGKKTLEHSWDQVFYVYRIRHSTCVYVEANRAYMVPLQEPETEERLWAMICEMLPAEKRFDRRK